MRFLSTLSSSESMSISVYPSPQTPRQSLHSTFVLPVSVCQGDGLSEEGEEKA